MKPLIGPIAILLSLVVSGCFPHARPIKSESPPVDPISYIQAPAKVPLGPGANIGHGILRETQVRGQSWIVSWAIVGDDPEHWYIETDTSVKSMAKTLVELRGLLLALKVRKSDGIVVDAIVGRPGEPTRAVKISPLPLKAAPSMDSRLCTVTLTMGGPYQARLFEVSKTKYWVGRGGEFEGIPLKYESPSEQYELEALPVADTYVLDGAPLRIKVLHFTNQMEIALADAGPVVTFAPYGDAPWGLLHLDNKDVELGIIRITTNEEPQLSWEPGR